MPRGPSQTAATNAPIPGVSPADPHLHGGLSPTLAGNFGSVSCWVTAPFLWVLVCKVLFMLSKIGVSVFPSPVEGF